MTMASARHFIGLLGLVAASAHAQVVMNGGFETPNLGSGNFQYQPAGGSWAFSGGAGISNINSGFTGGAPEVPGGWQIGFIQNVGALQQTVYLSRGAVLSFHATQRPYYTANQSLQVTVNGVRQLFKLGNQGGQQGSYTVTPPRDYYETYAVSLTAVLTSGYYTLRIEGINTIGDAT